eukprot:TRINITY_DN7467_c0_g1_i4.p1 TRINITY_DN7467_c0_g1~~TRINITY_DN7467_c0_g1_i4.p1  ORF type:complete len:711 (+),score=34.65 TRINITY_DN7467_c0_g1_i4:97-2229(+)
MCIRDSNNSIFDSNKAQDGGAIFHDTRSLGAASTHSLLSENCEITNNFASVKGGGVFWNYVAPKIKRNSRFDNNTARLYGGNIASYSIALILHDCGQANLSTVDPLAFPDISSAMQPLCQHFQTSWGKRKDLEINTLFSSIPAKPLCFALIDPYGRVVKSDNTTIMVLQMATTDDSSVDTSLRKFKAINGYFNFTTISLDLASPGHVLRVDFTMERTHALWMALQDELKRCQTDPSQEFTDTVKRIRSQLLFRNCSAEDEVPSPNGKFCEVCPPGSYKSRASFRKECLTCPSLKAVCKDGRIFPSRGYWRITNQTDETYYHKCPRANACLNDYGESISTGKWEITRICSRHHEGRLCASCEEGYAHNSPQYKCLLCKFSLWEMGKVVIFLMQIINIIWLIKTSQEASKSFTLMCDKKAFDEHDLPMYQEQLAKRKFSAAIKLFMTYSQMLALLLTSTFISESDDAVDFRLVRFSFDCLYQGKGSTATRAENMIFWQTSLPFFSTLILILVASLIYIILRYLKSLKQTRDSIISCAIVIFYSMQPAILKSSLKLFRKMNIGDQNKELFVVKEAYEIGYDSETHNDLVNRFGIPGLVLCISIPLGLLLYLRGKGQGYIIYKDDALLVHQLDESKKEILKTWMSRFNYLFISYDARRYYWFSTNLPTQDRNGTYVFIGRGSAFFGAPQSSSSRFISETNQRTQRHLTSLCWCL